MKKLITFIYLFSLIVLLPTNVVVLSLAYFFESYSHLFYPSVIFGIGLCFIIILAYCFDEYFNKD